MANDTPKVQISDDDAVGEFRDSYSVVIHNNSVSNKNYTLSIQPPSLEPNDIQVNTHVIRVAKGVPNDGGVVRFEIPNQLYAICGYNDLPARFPLSEDGTVVVIAKATIEVVAKAPVTLGSHSKDGTINAASSLAVSYIDETLSFASAELVPSLTTVGGFTITTGGGFTSQQAKKKNFFLGLCSGHVGDIEGFHATWLLQPNTTYIVRPTRAFCVSIGALEPRTIIDPTELNSTRTAVANFKDRKDGLITFDHTMDGGFVLQKASRI